MGMAALDWLSLLPGLDLSAGTLTVSLWVAGGAAGLLVLLLFLAAVRVGTAGALGAVVGLGVVVVVAASAVTVINRHDRAEERRALDTRLATLTASAVTPGSMLGCLDGNIGEAVEGSCERAVFASPESVAAATTYVSARLALLIDGLDFANRVDPNFETTLTGLRRVVETDRYGFVAQILASREGCTPAKCDTFQWLRDATRIRANLNERTFDGLVGRNASNWPARSRAAVPVAGAPAAAPASSPPSSGISFPSAASIPPVSIMSSEPSAAAPQPPAASAPPAARRPAASAPPRSTQPRAPTAAPPVQLTPPAATAGTQPPRPQQQ
jgi:hypothetical protein